MDTALTKVPVKSKSAKRPRKSHSSENLALFKTSSNESLHRPNWHIIKSGNWPKWWEILIRSLLRILTAIKPSKQLIFEYEPTCIAIEVINLTKRWSNSDFIQLQKCYNKNCNYENTLRASGRVATFIKNSHYSEEITFNTSVEAIAVTIWKPTPLWSAVTPTVTQVDKNSLLSLLHRF